MNRDFAAQLERTYVVTTVGIFVVLLMWMRAMLPGARPEPLVQLPRAANAVKFPEAECETAISVQADGSLFCGSESVKPAQLAAVLKQRRCHDLPLLLRVDKDAPYSAARAVVVAARDAGWRRIAFLVIFTQPLEADNPFAMDFSPDYRTFGVALCVALALTVAAAVGKRRLPGSLVKLLLLIAVLAAMVAWDALFPSCPRGYGGVETAITTRPTAARP